MCLHACVCVTSVENSMSLTYSKCVRGVRSNQLEIWAGSEISYTEAGQNLFSITLVVKKKKEKKQIRYQTICLTDFQTKATFARHCLTDWPYFEHCCACVFS